MEIISLRSLDGFTRHDRKKKQQPAPSGPVLRSQNQFTELPRPSVDPRTGGAQDRIDRRANNQQVASDRSIDLGTIDTSTIDISTPKPKTRRRFWLFGKRIAKKPKKPWSRRKKITASIIGVVAAIILGVGGYMLWKFLNTTGKVLNGGNFFAAVLSNDPLKTDQYGRSNILLFGTSEDDPGHPGGDLTDSIMMISVDQKKHDAFLVSIPRDLWVKFGEACPSGYEGKINEVYMCGKEDGGETGGQNMLKEKVAEIFGADIQYTVHVNYEVLRKSVDALGGVDITIESDDDRGILDRNFDWRCNYECYLVKWPNGPAHLDGEHALYLAQARNDAGGYGLPRGNFDREANQRKILIAAKDKAMGAGFLANPVKVTKLLDSLGENVRTNFQASEVKTLMSVLKNTDSNNITSISLIDQDPALLTTGTSPIGSSIVQPSAGIYSYSALQSFLKAYLSGNAGLIKEKAVVDVLNGTDTPGVAQTKADELTAAGITVGSIDNAPDGTYGTVKLYDRSNGQKPETKKKLEELLKVTATTEPVPDGITTDASFVVIVGQSAN